MLNSVQATVERLDRLEAALVEFVPGWSMAPVVSAFQAMRGVQFMTAVTVVAEAGNLRRFGHSRQLMAFLGLVPSERSTGETRRQGGITNTGNSSARKLQGSVAAGRVCVCIRCRYKTIVGRRLPARALQPPEPHDRARHASLNAPMGISIKAHARSR
jgi:transposase